jgi:hypothetical protein
MRHAETKAALRIVEYEDIMALREKLKNLRV